MLKKYMELLVAGGVVITVAVGVAWYFLDAQQQDIDQTLAINQQRVRELEPIATEAESLSATINTISTLLDRKTNFSELLTDIGGVMPPGAVLTGLEVSIEDLKAPLVLSAQVDNEAKAAVLKNNLESSDLFERVSLKSIVEIGADTATTTPLADQPNPSAPQAGPYRYTATLEVYFAKTTGAQR